MLTENFTLFFQTSGKGAEETQRTTVQLVLRELAKGMISIL
jgi:hypothetical protein